MQIPSKILDSGFSLPVIGLGTWQMGGRMEADISQDDLYESAIRANIDHGVTLIDTAELYGGGHTEEIIGKVIRDTSRDSLFLVSKVKPGNLSYADTIRSCEESLRRLGTDYLDIYLIHRRNYDIPLEETMRALDMLVSRGLVKHIGVCNFSVDSLTLAQSLSKNKIVLNQCHYNLFYREPEVSGMIQYCQDNDILLQAWRPFELGAIFQKDFPSIDKISAKYGKSRSKIALKWLISQKNITTLAKMSRREHIDENLDIFDWDMESDDIEFLRQEFEEQYIVSNREPLL